ncbi:MAG TPA: hypothetical protein PLK58_16175 [Candidatus Rifleibacterium sp.]|jgi:hypothetical protein|nr:hypothetical protein [Candidatus Rifleibacterium sp.]HPW60187.1 hypothetical protein [Candidatus Rifleibacterium sp.]
MNQRANRGMTLLELLIGFFLLVSASIIFFQAMHSFKKETTFTSENFLAASLTEKVLEQCYQEADLNPHGLQAIGLADADGALYPFSTFVTDRETIFFSNPGITDTETPNLHKLLKENFNLKVSGKKTTGFYEITAGFNWKAASGKGGSLTSTRILSFTGEKEVLTTFALSDAEVKNRLVKDVFNAPGAALGSKVSSAGAEKLLLDIGHIYYTCNDWLNSAEFKDRYQKARSLEIVSSPASEDYEKCTRMYFDLARDMLHLMMSLKGHAEEANKQISFLASVPKPEKYIIESRIERGGLFYRQLRRLLFNCLFRVAERYEQQSKNARSPKHQRQLIIRLFNINRILFANRSFSDEVPATEIESRYRSFITRMQTAFREADPSIFRLADQEKTFITAGNLKDRFFMLKLTGELFATIDKFLTVLDPA